MKNVKPTSRKLPLILILIGTAILSIPGAVGTFLLLDAVGFSFGFTGEQLYGKLVLLIAVAGFALFGGYISAYRRERHNSLFWLCSAFYNFGLTAFMFYFLLYDFIASPAATARHFAQTINEPFWLLPVWTIFVTIASLYYCKFARRAAKDFLP